MRLSALLSTIFVAMLGSALAFLLYVPVLSILATAAVLFGMLGAFGGGLMIGRRSRHATARRPAVIVPIDSAIPDRQVMALSRSVR